MPRHQTAAQALAEALREAIRSGEYAPGEQLPSTRELVDQFSASKVTIAKALATLKRERLIDCQSRRRPVVRRRRSLSRRVLSLVYHSEHLAAAAAPTWFGQILMNADRALLEAGFQSTRSLIAWDKHTSDATIEQRLDELVSQDTAGVLLRGGGDRVEMLVALLDAREIPWISIKPVSRRIVHNYVEVDHFDATRTVGQLFARSGRERVAFLGVGISEASISTLSGFELGYIEAGGRHDDIACLLTESSAWQEDAGYQRVRAHLEAGRRIDAILGHGDYLAMGAIRALREAGYRVPEDVAVVGMTGLEISAYTRPSLSIVRQPMGRVGQTAAELLLESIRSERHHVMGVECAAEIVLRESFDASDGVLEQVNAMAGRTAVSRQFAGAAQPEPFAIGSDHP